MDWIRSRGVTSPVDFTETVKRVFGQWGLEMMPLAWNDGFLWIRTGHDDFYPLIKRELRSWQDVWDELVSLKESMDMFKDGKVVWA